jgi:hypothetical protein
MDNLTSLGERNANSSKVLYEQWTLNLPIQEKFLLKLILKKFALYLWPPIAELGDIKG